MNDVPDDRPADLRALPRERIPPAHLEERTVAALRAEGLLQVGAAPKHTPRRVGAGWVAAAAAAAVALFAGGFVAGQADGTRRTVEIVEALHQADAARTAALIQRSGSDYVAALAALGDAGSAADTGPGREVARSVVRSALEELSRLEPDDADLRRALAALGSSAGARGATSSDSLARAARAILWF